MGARFDWDEQDLDAAEGTGGYKGDDFDWQQVRWPLWLEASIFYCQTKPNAKETGDNTSVGYRIETEGPWEGYGFFQSFVSRHEQSEKAQAIGRKKLSRLAKACDFEHGMDFDELPDYATNLDVKVDVERSRGYEDRLTVIDWAPRGTKVSSEACERQAKLYKPPAKPAETGSHRYSVDESPKQAEPVKEEPLGKGDPDDAIPFATMGYASTRSRRSPLASIRQVPW